MSEPVIQLEGVSFGYDGVEVLSEVDLSVAQGDFLAIIGPNGGGKTTLLRLILGLLRPRNGQVRVFGRPPGEEPGRIGYVPQHGNLPPGFPASVEQVVLMGLAHGWRHGPHFRSDERERARVAMHRTGVEELGARRMDELSGGQRQRVLVARALITEPELLLLDEPLSNIDPYGRQCVLETLTGLASGTTIVMVSHDLGVTANAVTGIAAVNHYLLQAPGRQLTPDMVKLMYGVHEAGCPADEALRELVESLPTTEAHHDHH